MCVCVYCMYIAGRTNIEYNSHILCADKKKEKYNSHMCVCMYCMYIAGRTSTQNLGERMCGSLSGRRRLKRCVCVCAEGERVCVGGVCPRLHYRLLTLRPAPTDHAPGTGAACRGVECVRVCVGGED